MAWRATIGGDDHTADLHQESGVAIELPLNERASASFVCRPGYIPARFAEVVLYAQDGSTPVFGGVVLSRAVQGAVYGATPMFCAVTCGDYATYADWCYTTQDYTTGPTLKAVLQDLIADNLAAYGVTLHASQVTGPTLAAFSWYRKRVSDALRELSDRTGYVWRIDASKQLRMVVPGSEAAPVTLTDAGPNCRDLTWRDTDDQPANTVTLACGPTGTGTVRQQWIADGIASSWVTDLEAVNPPPPLVEIDDGVTPYLGTVSIGAGGQFQWDAATHTLSLGTAALPAAGTKIVLGGSVALGDHWDTPGYTTQYPFTVTATTGASPVIEYQAAAPDVLTLAAAQEMADGLLEQLDQQPRELSWLSGTSGWAPGQLATIDLTGRDFDATAIITAVSIHLVSDTWWEYTCQATENAKYTGSYLDQWREMTGGSSSIATISGSGGGSTTTLSSPAYLGGSRIASVPMGASPAYTPVLSWVPFYAAATFTGRVRVELWARTAGVGVTARLYDVTAGVAVGTSSKVTSTAAVEAPPFTAVITSGHAYRLDIISDTASESAYGIGQLEAA